MKEEKSLADQITENELFKILFTPGRSETTGSRIYNAILWGALALPLALSPVGITFSVAFGIGAGVAFFGQGVVKLFSKFFGFNDADESAGRPRDTMADYQNKENRSDLNQTAHAAQQWEAQALQGSDLNDAAHAAQQRGEQPSQGQNLNDTAHAARQHEASNPGL